MRAGDILREKLDREMSEFKASYRDMSVTEVYNDWYIIGFKEEYFEMLMSDFTEGRFNDKEIAWLSSLEKPLDFLYDAWMDCDGAMDHNWDSMIDFVRGVYYDEKHREKQNLYYDIKALGVKVVENAPDDFLSQFDYFGHVSDNPFVFSAELPNNFDEEVDKTFGAFFKENLLVKSCDYGCDTFPCGVSKAVVPGNVQIYRPEVWNFIEAVEQMFECKCTYYNEVNGFEFVISFGEDDSKGCYVFGAGNNGQEYSQCLYFNNPDQLNNADFVKAITTIDKAFYTLLEEYELCVVPKVREVSLEDKINEAQEQKEASVFDGYPTLAQIREDYANLMELIKDIRTVEAAREYDKEHPSIVEINGVCVDEFVKNGGTDKDIEWIRYEAFGCLSYVYDRFDGKPLFDVWSDGSYDEFIRDIQIDDLTEENYTKWVKEDLGLDSPVRTTEPDR